MVAGGDVNSAPATGGRTRLQNSQSRCFSSRPCHRGSVCPHMVRRYLTQWKLATGILPVQLSLELQHEAKPSACGHRYDHVVTPSCALCSQGPGKRMIHECHRQRESHTDISNGAMFPKAWSAHSSGRDARRRSVWIILSVRRISLGRAGLDASNPSRRSNRRVTKWDAPGRQGSLGDRGGVCSYSDGNAPSFPRRSPRPHGFFDC